MKGFSTLLSMFVFLGLLVIIATGMTFVSISGLKSSSYISASQLARQDSESCVEEVLRRLRDDIDYAGGLIPLNDTSSCNATVTGDSSQKTISATVSNSSLEKNVMVAIDVIAIGEAHNFRITDWQEN